MNVRIADFVRFSRQFAERFEAVARENMDGGKLHSDDRAILRNFRRRLDRLAVEFDRRPPQRRSRKHRASYSVKPSARR